MVEVELRGGKRGKNAMLVAGWASLENAIGWGSSAEDAEACVGCRDQQTCTASGDQSMVDTESATELAAT